MRKYVASHKTRISFYPTPFFKKRRGFCNCLRPSVCPLCYLLNHWRKSSQIWRLVTHMNGACNSAIWPRPWGVVKRLCIIKFQLQVNFKDLYRTWCVFSKIKDFKHIEQDFNSVAWVMPQGWVGLGGARGQIFFRTSQYLESIRKPS